MLCCGEGFFMFWLLIFMLLVFGCRWLVRVLSRVDLLYFEGLSR